MLHYGKFVIELFSYIQILEKEWFLSYHGNRKIIFGMN